MRRKIHLDDRGLPTSSTIEYSEAELRRGRYGALRLLFLLPLLALGYLVGRVGYEVGWHPVFALAAGSAVPIISGILLHFLPWLRLLYNGAVVLACATVAFLVGANPAAGGDAIWGSAAAVVAILIGGWMTYLDLRGAGD